MERKKDNNVGANGNGGRGKTTINAVMERRSKSLYEGHNS